MGWSFLPCVIVTAFWFAVGVVLPFFTPKGNNRGVIQLSLVLTAATCWLFWLCCYMCQMNPLIGPKLKNGTIFMMAAEWGNRITDL
uniref:V-type proton ATPase subunit n=1 Tax=Riptortus pedestris TaxID=329032 RepID=R4WRA2_RIPPE|nr:vacuolar H[+] ATPase subunit [Riptortus pedestris]